MKKVLSVMLAGLMVFTMVGCGKKDEDSKKNEDTEEINSKEILQSWISTSEDENGNLVINFSTKSAMEYIDFDNYENAHLMYANMGIPGNYETYSDFKVTVPHEMGIIGYYMREKEFPDGDAEFRMNLPEDYGYTDGKYLFVVLPGGTNPKDVLFSVEITKKGDEYEIDKDSVKSFAFPDTLNSGDMWYSDSLKEEEK